MYGIPIIEQVPVAAPFDPSTVAVENTVVVFGPRTEFQHVPFDVVLLSSVYGYFHVIGNRRSYQNKIRGHIYSSAVAELPWNDAIADHAGALIAIRTDLLAACKRRFEQTSHLASEAAALGLQTLKTVVRTRKGAKVAPSETFISDPDVILAVGAVVPEGGEWRLPLDANDEHAIYFNDEEIAQLARTGLLLLEGNELTWPQILAAPMPTSEAMAAALQALRDSYAPERLDQAINEQVAKIDAIVGVCLGLAPSDIEAVRTEMEEDPFLSRVSPRYPYFRPRQYGRRINLERRDRYSS